MRSSAAAERDRRRSRKSDYPSQQAAPGNCVKCTRVIMVRVPIDLHAVAASRSSAFASATPLRLYHLLALAVREAIGARAPHDFFARTMRATLAGLRAGRFIVDVDGRTFEDPDEVVVCRD